MFNSVVQSFLLNAENNSKLIANAQPLRSLPNVPNVDHKLDSLMEVGTDCFMLPLDPLAMAVAAKRTRKC